MRAAFTSNTKFVANIEVYAEVIHENDINGRLLTELAACDLQEAGISSGLHCKALITKWKASLVDG